MSRLVAVLAAVLVPLLLAWPPDAAAQQVVRIGHVGFPGSLFDIVATEYAKR